MRETPEWTNAYWQYINQHDPVGREKPQEDRGLTQNQIAHNAVEYADEKIRNWWGS